MKSWEKIYKWLDANAPGIKNALQPPAEIDLIEKIESISETKLPQEFVNLYLTHNGLSPDLIVNFFYGMTFIPLERVIIHLEEISKRESDFDLQFADEGIKPGYRLGVKRIPLADDYGSSLLCIDLDPSEKGVCGQVVLIDYKMDTGLLLADSISKLLSNFAADLESGKYSLNKEALLDGVEFLEPERSIDVISWYNSPTWAYVNAKK